MKKKKIGKAPVRFTGSALYFCQDNGTFEDKKHGVKGSFASTVGSAAIIVYIERDAYECRTEDIVAVALEHHLRRRKKQAKKAAKKSASARLARGASAASLTATSRTTGGSSTRGSGAR